MTDGVYAFNKFRRQRVYPAFALDTFDHNARDFVFRNQLFHTVQIVGHGMDKTLGQRLEQFVVMLLPCSGQGGKGTPMETVPQRNDRIIFRTFFLRRVFPCYFDSAFVGFATGIAEEHFLHSCLFTEQLRQVHAGFRVIQVGHVLHLAQLVDNRLLPGVVSNAEAGDADAGPHVNIFFSLRIFCNTSFAADDFHRKPGIGVGYVLVIQFLQLAHVLTPLSPWYPRLHPSAIPSGWNVARARP